MTFSRRSFFGALAGAACSVLGVVYGVPEVGDDVGEYWQSVVEQYRPVTQEKLEIVFGRHFNLMVEQPRSNFVLT